MINNFIKSIMRFLSKLLKWEPTASTDNITEILLKPPEAEGKPPAEAPKLPVQPAYLWDTQKHSYHSVRVICDEMGLSHENKNLICSVVMGESQFYNDVTNRNKNAKGEVTSTDWGIVQCNDYWHIGKNKTFPSVEWVLANPEEMVRWMIKMYRAGRLDMWCAFSNKSYAQWLKPTSKMWKIGV